MLSASFVLAQIEAGRLNIGDMGSTHQLEV
jgi:hypothetical protein